MTKTPSERSKAHRDKKLAEGYKQKAFLLSPSALAILTRKAVELGKSETAVVEWALQMLDAQGKTVTSPPKPVPHKPKPRAERDKADKSGKHRQTVPDDIIFTVANTTNPHVPLLDPPARTLKPGKACPKTGKK